jgi:hypothetical protein
MLIEYMADIEVKKRSDSRAVVTILKEIAKCEVDLQTVKLAKTEKFMRDLSSIPLSIFTTNKSDFELMKKLGRDLLKDWADRRRKQILIEELISGEVFKHKSSGRQGPAKKKEQDEF